MTEAILVESGKGIRTKFAVEINLDCESTAKFVAKKCREIQEKESNFGWLLDIAQIIED